MQRTEISELGEFGLIDRLSKQVEHYHKSSVKGIGDDAAILAASELQRVVTTDLLLEGIHFDLRYMPLQHLGYKAVAVNVSDVAAMNAIPTQITVSIGLSNRFSVEAVEALYEGIRAACASYKVDLIGGDTTASAAGLVLSVTAIGEAEADKIATRSGVKKGDIVCVTGDLGAAYMGLQVLEREKQVFLANPDASPEIGNYKYIVQRQLRPEARMDVVHELRELGVVPTAMIDVSDGLASELLHLARQSGMGLQVYEENLPIDKMTYDTAVEFGLDPITCVMNGGEDYELLFTIRQEDHEKVKAHADIHFIGYATELAGQAHLITKGGSVVPLKAQGFNHFKE
ncbi:thiamine-phosphate kinase [Cesiribacter andamanensis]|uniref:Thiamine-monophosphate kinase n=1 Tax=Cesiribacter andamanensis AMV16 TaxID=1279009 RepID=M7NSR9_9BACT|nr:thiamine-phosphate kinase [Cesiribacter andamanensis]EMR01544.1 Thiamine-monophosphate kinase [Cesiribacter andamanensis AMV16]